MEQHPTLWFSDELPPDNGWCLLRKLARSMDLQQFTETPLLGRYIVLSAEGVRCLLDRASFDTWLRTHGVHKRRVLTVPEPEPNRCCFYWVRLDGTVARHCVEPVKLFQ